MGAFAVVFNKQKTRTVNKKAFAHGFYGSVAKRSLQKHCKDYAKLTVTPVGLPDIPYFPGAPVFRPLSPVSWTEAKISRI